MPPSPPTLELLPNPGSAPPAASASDAAGRIRSARRIGLFLAVLLTGLAASLTYVWMREPVYQSAASVLTVAPTAIDREDSAASPQHAAVQRQTLLSIPLLEETRRRLLGDAGADLDAVPTVDQLHGMLAVKSVPNTPVVELRARGAVAAHLAPVLNAWIDAYQSLREADVQASKARTTAALDEEVRQLERRIEAKRAELDEFRRRHDLVAEEGADNQALSRFRGLNEALNKAASEEVTAGAKVDAMREAIARGEPVVPPEEQQGLESLQARLQELREQAKDLHKRYTPQYVALEPKLKLIPEQLAQTESAIRKLLEDGKHAALSEAEQAHASARQSVLKLQRQIDERKREAAEFTARFAERKTLTADLQQLEEAHRKTQSRMALVEAKPIDHYPQLKVIERAYTPKAPLWPDYWRDSGIAAAGSLGLALLVLLIYDFVTRRERDPGVQLPDIQVYTVSENLLSRSPFGQGPALPDGPGPTAIAAREPLRALDRPQPRELTDPELRLLLESGDPRARPMVGLILSGLTPEEIALLTTTDIDLAGNALRVAGSAPRQLPLAPKLRAWLEQAGLPATWDGAADPEEFSAMISCAAADAGLAQPETVDAAAIRHACLLYLVRQGLRLAELERVVGKLPAKVLAGYARFSPPGPGLPLDAVPLIHPALRADTGTSANVG